MSLNFNLTNSIDMYIKLCNERLALIANLQNMAMELNELLEKQALRGGNFNYHFYCNCKLYFKILFFYLLCQDRLMFGLPIVYVVVFFLAYFGLKICLGYIFD